MNTFTAFALTMALSLGGASTAFASNMNGQVPQAKDLSAQEMNSAVGAGQIYWRTHGRYTKLKQWDPGYHQRTVRPGKWNIGRHYIHTGRIVQVWCKGNHGVRQARFRMPKRNVWFHC